MSNKTIKIQIITDHQDYKKGQIVELDEKAAVTLLINGKALKIHRKQNQNPSENSASENKIEENSEEKITEKENKKSKKNDQ